MAFISKLKKGLTKTRDGVTKKINNIVKSIKIIDEDFFDEIEEILITSDIGFETTEYILKKLRTYAKENKIKETENLIKYLKNELDDILKSADHIDLFNDEKKIILVVGVNGVGKTTSIGKIANIYKKRNKKVVVAAADTFRAGAIEQLEIWTQRAGVDIVKQKEGADPSAVIYDALNYFDTHNFDVLICDTAGRLHNKKNLMQELGKIYRTINKKADNIKLYTLLVVDASTGQNGVSQAKTFKESADVDGIILTKVDGTAKGGIVFSISKEVDLPVKFIGVGEKIEDLEAFDADEFIKALFES